MNTQNFEVSMPIWAKFYTQNENGDWRVFDCEPTVDERKGKWRSDSLVSKYLCTGPRPEDWTNELYEVEK